MLPIFRRLKWEQNGCISPICDDEELRRLHTEIEEASSSSGSFGAKRKRLEDGDYELQFNTFERREPDFSKSGNEDSKVSDETGMSCGDSGQCLRS